jgi:hypothetical protein
VVCLIHAQQDGHKQGRADNPSRTAAAPATWLARSRRLRLAWLLLLLLLGWWRQRRQATKRLLLLLLLLLRWAACG